MIKEKRINLPAVYNNFNMNWKGTAWIVIHENMLNKITVKRKQRNFTESSQSLKMMKSTLAQFKWGFKQMKSTIYVITAENVTVKRQGSLNCCMTHSFYLSVFDHMQNLWQKSLICLSKQIKKINVILFKQVLWPGLMLCLIINMTFLEWANDTC